MLLHNLSLNVPVSSTLMNSWLAFAHHKRLFYSSYLQLYHQVTTNSPRSISWSRKLNQKGAKKQAMKEPTRGERPSLGQMFRWPFLSCALRSVLKTVLSFEATPFGVCWLPSIPLSTTGSSSRSRKAAHKLSICGCRMSHTGLQTGWAPLRVRQLWGYGAGGVFFPQAVEPNLPLNFPYSTYFMV